MYKASDIYLRVRNKPILSGVSVSIHPGSFTAVVGPNGAGKSSLLRVIAHEHSAYEGEVFVNGKKITSYSSKELSLIRAVLPQNTSVQFSFSVKQIISLGRHAHRTSSRQNENIIAEVMSLTDTDKFSDRNYLTLSGGEKQRVQLARVLAQVWDESVYPRYILLDEPTSSLDIAQQQHIFNLAKRVCERNIGVLAIVHDLNQAARFADHLYFLKDGKLIDSGTPKQVFNKQIIEETFCCRVNVYHDPCNNCPYIIPDREMLSTDYSNKLKIN